MPAQAVEAENSRRQDLTPEQMQATSQGSVGDRFAELQPGRHEPVSLPEGEVLGWTHAGHGGCATQHEALEQALARP